MLVLIVATMLLILMVTLLVTPVLLLVMVLTLLVTVILLRVVSVTVMIPILLLTVLQAVLTVPLVLVVPVLQVTGYLYYCTHSTCGTVSSENSSYTTVSGGIYTTMCVSFGTVFVKNSGPIIVIYSCFISDRQCYKDNLST